MASPTTMNSLSDLVSEAARIRDEWSGGREDEVVDPWFRGQANADWNLIPSGYQLYAFQESEMRSDFKRRALSLISEGRPSSEWEWYFLARHFGLPTRLLDWTSGALVALYFAVREQLNVDAAVWVLDPFFLNKEVLGCDEILDANHRRGAAYLVTEGLPEWPIAIEPPHVTRRIAAQLGYFTVHGSNRCPLNEVSASSGPKIRLEKIIIPRNSVERIRDDLQTCGITETTVFPDLDALCRELRRDWAGDPMTEAAHRLEKAVSLSSTSKPRRD